MEERVPMATVAWAVNDPGQLRGAPSHQLLLHNAKAIGAGLHDSWNLRSGADGEKAVRQE